MTNTLPLPIATQILDHFAAGQSVNHIVYLLHYQYDTDHVNAAIRERLRELGAENARLKAEAAELLALHPRDEWHDDIGTVLWHSLNDAGQVCEPPFVETGTPGEGVDMHEARPNYYTHWSRLPNVKGLPDGEVKP